MNDLRYWAQAEFIRGASELYLKREWSERAFVDAVLLYAKGLETDQVLTGAAKG